ncbi:MAG: proton-conducting transporter membrane subunit, partial [Eubacteriales bacterium]|nr:proton-conducting transporter membrane subunit [Eubacteriales bacterium]
MQSTIPFLTFELKMDALSAFFVLALSILVLCVSIYSIDYLSHYIGKRPLGLFHFLYALFILSMMFVLTSSNALFFYIAWEVMALVSYFLVIFESEKEENRKAGALYVVMTHLATAFLLGGFMIVYRYTGSFDLFGSAEAVPELVKNIVFLFFVIGFGTKAGMIPLHIWLPYAHPAAPSNVSALMSGIMIKTAVYGLARFVIGFLGIEQTWWGVLILSLGIISAVLGVAYALMEQNIKRLLAFSSVENMGIILIGMGAAMIALSKGNSFVAALALTACLFHTLNHSLFKGGLFLGA